MINCIIIEFYNNKMDFNHMSLTFFFNMHLEDLLIHISCNINDCICVI